MAVGMGGAAVTLLRPYCAPDSHCPRAAPAGGSPPAARCWQLCPRPLCRALPPSHPKRQATPCVPPPPRILVLSAASPPLRLPLRSVFLGQHRTLPSPHQPPQPAFSRRRGTGVSVPPPEDCGCLVTITQLTLPAQPPRSTIASPQALRPEASRAMQTVSGPVASAFDTA